jgi:hypothetical protein
VESGSFPVQINQDITMAITTTIIIHFRIVHAIFPRNPRIMKITAIMRRRINRLIMMTNAPFNTSMAFRI